jgi:hypothetical protein
MLRIAVLAGTAVLAIGTACPICAQTVYQCVPDEPRAAAPDRLVSVEITLKPNGEFASVVYRVRERGRLRPKQAVRNGEPPRRKREVLLERNAAHESQRRHGRVLLSAGQPSDLY